MSTQQQAGTLAILIAGLMEIEGQPDSEQPRSGLFVKQRYRQSLRGLLYPLYRR